MHYIYVEKTYREFEALQQSLQNNGLELEDLTFGEIDHLIAARRAYQAGYYQS